MLLFVGLRCHKTRVIRQGPSNDYPAPPERGRPGMLIDIGLRQITFVARETHVVPYLSSF